MFSVLFLIAAALMIAAGAPVYVVLPAVVIALLLLGSLAVWANIEDYRERREWNRLSFLREYEAAIHLRDAARQAGDRA